MSAPELLWREKAPTRCARLRSLLEDSAWHPYGELVAAGGARFGARLLELKTGEDGGEPLAIQGRCGDDGVWWYRSRGPAERPHQPKSSAGVLAELRRENETLRREVLRLRAEVEERRDVLDNLLANAALSPMRGVRS